MKKTMKTSRRTRKPADKPKQPLQIKIDDLKRIVVHEWWPFIQRKYPKNQQYSLCGRMTPGKIYSNASKKYIIFGFMCTVTTYQPTGYEDPTRQLGPCWIGIQFSKRDRRWHLGSEEEFGDYLNEYLDDREAHGRDHMVDWKRIAFKANDRIALDEVDSSGISGYTLQPLDCNLLESKVKKQYTKKQITEAIAYWEKKLLNEAKDPSDYESFDSLKKKLDAELAKLSKADHDDVEYIKDNLEDLDSLRSGIYFGDNIDLPSGKTVWDIVGDFFMGCCDLLTHDVANRSSQFPTFEDNAVCGTLAQILITAALQNSRKCDSMIANDFADNEIQKWVADDEEESDDYYTYSIRLDWKEGLKILREYAKKFYDVWAKNFYKLDHKQFTIHYTAWHMDKYFVEVEAANEAEAEKIFFKDHAHEEYDMKDFEITSIEEN